MKHDPQHSRPQTEQAKQRLLTQSEPSHQKGIADAEVIKDADVFFLCQRDGSVPLGGDHGLGLYFHDCRYLCGYELQLAGCELEQLASDSADGFRAVFQLTNPNIDPVGQGISRQRLGLRWRHVIDARGRALRDELRLDNYDTEAHAVPLQLRFAADFRDVLAIRGMTDKQPGEQQPTRWDQDALLFGYRGGDNTERQLRIGFSRPPDRRGDDFAEFDLQLAPQQTVELSVTLQLRERRQGDGDAELHTNPDDLQGEQAFARSMADWMQGFTAVRTDDHRLEQVIDRSLRDLRALRMTVDGQRFFAAGVPWFTTLFGRDSIVCALQTLAYRSEIAAETLRLLARLQGQRVDDWRDEEPGKILHELRTGELARMRLVPYTPYYGTVDATPLFVVLLGEYTRWSGSLDLFRELRPAVAAALRWIDDYADHDGDGFVDYQAEGGERLINQGWKDSGGAILDADGSCAEPPIALVEVQGFVHRARLAAAALYERDGDAAAAAQQRQQAAELAERFDRDFWVDALGGYALALQRGKRPAAVVSSNPGQALWAGIVPPHRHRAVVERLLADDMYSGWGVRTLSSQANGYNPVGYHLGTVWPHDNGLIAAGFKANGFDAEACRVFGDLLHAASFFAYHRLPEAFAGYRRGDFRFPVHYPVACHPQAWAAGTMPYLLVTLLGLEPDGFERRLRLVRPCLPAFLQRVTLKRVQVAGAEVDLHFRRNADGELDVDVERRRGELEVVVERRQS